MGRDIRHRLLRERPQVLGTCTWCRKPVQKPRRYWCSDGCVTEYKVRSDPQYARRRLAERDREVCRACGLDCLWLQGFLEGLEQIHRPDDPPWLVERRPSHTHWSWLDQSGWLVSPDTKVRWGWVEQIHGHTRQSRPELFVGAMAEQAKLGPVHGISYLSWRDWFACEVLGLSLADARRRTYWEADHIVPVGEGGWERGLENLVVLCIWCHRQKTTRDVRRMRRKPEKRP